MNNIIKLHYNFKDSNDFTEYYRDNIYPEVKTCLGYFRKKPKKSKLKERQDQRSSADTKYFYEKNNNKNKFLSFKKKGTSYHHYYKKYKINTYLIKTNFRVSKTNFKLYSNIGSVFKVFQLNSLRPKNHFVYLRVFFF